MTMQKSTLTIVLIALLAVGGAYLVYDHGQHLVPYFPYVFILGMFAMHLFHGRHGGHRHDESDQEHDHGKSGK